MIIQVENLTYHYKTFNLNKIDIVQTISRSYFAKQSSYRLNFLMPYIIRILQLAPSIVVWNVLFLKRNTIDNYTFDQMVGYLILAQFALLVFYPFHMFSLQELIRKGTLNAYLLRPCHHILNSFAQFLGAKFSHLFLFFLFFF